MANLELGSDAEPEVALACRSESQGSHPLANLGSKTVRAIVDKLNRLPGGLNVALGPIDGNWIARPGFPSSLGLV